MIVGIDPGQNGAIAALDDDDFLYIYEMPIHLVKNKKEIDVNSLFQILTFLSALTKYSCIESVHSMPKQGVVSTFNFGFNYGILIGVLGAVGMHPIRIEPVTWKSSLRLSRSKTDSLEMAKKIFPKFTKHFKYKKDDGKAEAALMAYFLKKTLL